MCHHCYIYFCVDNQHKCILFSLSLQTFFLSDDTFFNCKSGLFSNNEDPISIGFINPHCYTNITKRHTRLDCQSSVHASMCNTLWACKVLLILCTTSICVVSTVYQYVYIKLCLHSLVCLGWSLDHVPFLIFLLYLYMYLLCEINDFELRTLICRGPHSVTAPRKLTCGFTSVSNDTGSNNKAIDKYEMMTYR